MKRYFASFLTMIVLFNLLSCSTNLGNTSNENSTQPAIVQNTDPVTEPATEPITQKDDGIQLTKDNFGKYFKFGSSCSTTGERFYVGNFENNIPGAPSGIPYQYGENSGITLYLYEKLVFRPSISGVSSNFNYEDVKVTIRFTGTYLSHPFEMNGTWTERELSEEFTLECNIVGDSKYNEVYVIAPNDEKVLQNVVKFNVEIVEITGKVVPVH